MSNFSVDITFSPSYFKKLGLKGKPYEDALSHAIDHAIHDAETICRKEAPVDTGNLRQSINQNKPEPLKGELLSTGAPYWVYVNYGTHKMAANPFVTRTANKVVPKFRRYIREELENEGLLD